MRAKGLLILALILPFCACGPLRPSSPANAKGIETYRRVDEQKALGKAQWLFAKPLNGLSAPVHYILEVLFLEDQSAITLHSHFNDFKWRDGVQVQFRRDHAHVSVSVRVPGFPAQNAALPDTLLGPDGRLKVRVEVHNSELSGVRVLIWGYNLSLQGDVASPRKFLSAANTDFDTRTLGWIFYDHGHGVHWGLEYENARVITATREAPYVP